MQNMIDDLTPPQSHSIETLNCKFNNSSEAMRYALLVLSLFLSTLSLNLQAQSDKSTTASWDKLPFDRLLKPAGDLIVLGDTTKESHALDCALSPDGRWLAVEERYSVSFISTDQNRVAFTLPLDKISGLKRAMSVYSGICWYQNDNENFVLFSASKGYEESYVVRLKWDGTAATVSKVFTYKPVSPAELALPNELLVSSELGHDYLYVVLNGNNQLLKQDLQTGDTVWVKNTGVAPYGIAFAHGKIYVTNWAGRVPEYNDNNVAGVPWGLARIDTATAGCREGSISVFDPATGMLLKEIVVGLHPNKIVASPDENHLYLTNSNSDMVSVIDAKTDEVSETISLRLQPDINHYFGDTPNSLAATADGKTLFVANGIDNAVAVVALGKRASTSGKGMLSSVTGFIPTAAYPSSISILNNKVLYVTNLESFGANRPYGFGPDHRRVFNSHHMLASLSVIAIPGKKQLADYTQTVIAANQLARLKEAELPARQGAEPKPVPDRIGEPSVFKHVLYIIKENRTYDQVLGDVAAGDGDSSLCVFGKKVTPNIHKLVGEFQLMDNFFVSGKCSAEGHSWTDASIVTDYVEKNVRAWFRSYPHVLYDALVYPSSGFIWDNARRHGVSVRIYGEAAIPEFNDSLTWSDVYSGFLKGESFHFTNKTTLNTVAEVLSPTYPGYDGHKIPDILRAKTFIDELKHYESLEGDSLPQLMVMALPNDHTSGTRPGFPTPGAMVADNDLALGQIMEALSHSRFWKNTVVFVVEDDSQDGWDHVSSYRTTAMVISPYSRIPETIHAPYNQPSMVRTIEQILGLPPMNIQDAIATPMFGCFTAKPNFAPYTAVSNQTPLDEMNPSLSELTGKKLHFAKLSLEPQFDGIDSGNDELFNRIIWFSTMGNIPYPSKYVSGEEE
ncbi:MAG TPA: bifunctional YncE family protein/alkaline phosphatase family protein [Williamwhitmania sp.]|nr:bifunctional YncE family protein/alkaline phosphatase family protein [Williamwhitmania sp.]